MNAWRSPADATASGPAYLGQAGVTRTEALHLRQAGGALRSVEVYRVVNVGTHPELERRVLGGALHRQPDGTELALPFVYHDPARLRFALVIPPALAHLELKERARLMNELAEDQTHPVPGYVREGVTVLGVAELEQYLRGGQALSVNSSRRSDPTPMNKGSGAKARIVASVSQLLGQVTQRGMTSPGGSAGVAVQRLTRSVPATLRESAGDPDPPPGKATTTAEIELTPGAPPPASVALSTQSAPGLGPAPALAAKQPPHPSAAPPFGMTVELSEQLERRELELSVKLDPDCTDAYDDEAELLVQLQRVADRNVVWLALLGTGDAVARIALDGHAPATLAVLDHLRKDFRALLHLYDGCEPRETREIFAPRELNAAAIARLVGAAGNAPTISAEEALVRCWNDPPKLRDPQLPFGPARLQQARASSVLMSIDQLLWWQRPECVERALVVHSVPKHVIDAWQRRVLLSALAVGIALPEPLVALALEHGLAPNATALVRQQLTAFQQQIERAQNDLDAPGTQRNWLRLRAQAEALQLSSEPAGHLAPGRLSRQREPGRK